MSTRSRVNSDDIDADAEALSIVKHDVQSPPIKVVRRITKEEKLAKLKRKEERKALRALIAQKLKAREERRQRREQRRIRRELRWKRQQEAAMKMLEDEEQKNTEQDKNISSSETICINGKLTSAESSDDDEEEEDDDGDEDNDDEEEETNNNDEGNVRTAVNGSDSNRNDDDEGYTTFTLEPECVSQQSADTTKSATPISTIRRLSNALLGGNAPLQSNSVFPSPTSILTTKTDVNSSNTNPENGGLTASIRRLSVAVGLNKLFSGSENDRKVNPLPVVVVGNGDSTGEQGEDSAKIGKSVDNIQKQYLQAEEGRKYDEQVRRQQSSMRLQNRLSKKGNNASTTDNSTDSSHENNNKQVLHDKMKEHVQQDARRKASVLKVKHNSRELMLKRLTERKAKIETMSSKDLKNTMKELEEEDEESDEAEEEQIEYDNEDDDMPDFFNEREEED
jgi:hypothetical protein